MRYSSSVCSRTPYDRASAALSFISAGVTVNGEHGAIAIRSIDSRDATDGSGGDDELSAAHEGCRCTCRADADGV